MKRRLFAAVTLAMLGSSTGSRAFESGGGEIGMATHNPSLPHPSWPHGVNYQFEEKTAPNATDTFTVLDASRVPSSTRVNYQAAISTLGHGGPGDRSVRGIYQCPESAVTGGDPIQVNWAACWPLRHQDVASAGDQAFLTSRRAWGGRNPTTGKLDSEHLAITQMALDVAGLADKRLFTERFWLRYPTADKWVLGNGAKVGDMPTVLAAGSLVPTTPLEGRALRSRAVSIPELVEVPDHSHSFWDWLAGNEVCPVGGLVENGVSAVGGVTLTGDSGTAPRTYWDRWACHDYTRVPGAVNAPHFLPTARRVYQHYHALALTRMSECRGLVRLDAQFDAPDAKGGAEGKWTLHRAPGDTESRECVREAFAYEMFALHFLEDAWSSGHMWARWGFPEIRQFPNKLGSPPYVMTKDGVALPMGLSDTEAPPEAWAPRRYLIALTTAAFAGSIHGSKAVAAGKLAEMVAFAEPIGLPDFVRSMSVVSDPLSGPWYDIRLEDTDWSPALKRTSWVDRMTGGVGPTPGVGDMFFDPVSYVAEPPRDPYVGMKTDPAYALQLQRMIGCTATSLRQLYRASPLLDGEMAPMKAVAGTAIAEEAFDPTSDVCWTHWATNHSMLASLSPLNLSRDFRGGVPDRSTVNKFVHWWLVNQIVDKRIEFVTLARDMDTLRFLRALRDRVETDLLRLEIGVSARAFEDPNGDASARMSASSLAMVKPKPNCESTEPDGGARVPDAECFLNVAPNDASAELAPFYDVGTPRPGVPSDLFVSRAFWRSHIRETCAAATQSVTLPDTGVKRSAMEELRDRCVRGAAKGGDPEACTQCVDMAELHIPQCGIGTDAFGTIGQSKCRAVDASFDASLLPPLWSDGSARRAMADKSACGQPSYNFAVSYCTGTALGVNGYSSVLSNEPVGLSKCQSVDPLTGVLKRRTLFKTRLRVAAIRQEVGLVVDRGDGMGKLEGSSQSVPSPWVVAFEKLLEDLEDPETCRPLLRDSLDNLLTAGPLQGLPLYNGTGTGTAPDLLEPALISGRDPLALIPCGVYQRHSFWNQSCETVDSQWPIPSKPTGLSGLYDPDTGFQAFTSDLPAPSTAHRCSLRESRFFKPECSAQSSLGDGPSMPRVCTTSGMCSAGVRFDYGKEVSVPTVIEVYHVDKLAPHDVAWP